MTDRDDLMRSLVDFSSPLSPFEDFEDKERRRDAWLAGLDESATDGLLDILDERSDRTARGNVREEDFEMNLAEALAAAGAQEPDRLIERIAPLLANGRARPVIIDVMGLLDSHRSIPLIGDLLASERLTVDELVRLACTLGEIGGAEARNILGSIEALPGADDPELRQEVAIARGNITKKRTPTK